MIPIHKNPTMLRLREEFATGRRLSVYDAADLVCRPVRRVREYIKWLHEERAIHIAEWRRDHASGPAYPVYMNGPGRNARRPRKMTAAETMRVHRLRKQVAALQTVLAAT